MGGAVTDQQPVQTKKKVLVVDDEPDVITYLKTLLEDEGYEVISAENADEAMIRLLQEKPDLVSLDIMMPKKSGIAFYRTMKLDERTKDIPAIFVSAFSIAQNFKGESFRNLIPETEVPEPEAYIEKPIEIPKLMETIHTIVG